MCDAGRSCGVQSICLYGGTSKGPQISSLKSGIVSYQVLLFLWMVCIQMPVEVTCLYSIDLLILLFSIQDIIIGTPGRIQDLIEMGICCLKEVSFVVSCKLSSRILFFTSLLFLNAFFYYEKVISFIC